MMKAIFKTFVLAALTLQVAALPAHAMGRIPSITGLKSDPVQSYDEDGKKLTEVPKQTFMSESGQFSAKVVGFYKEETLVLVQSPDGNQHFIRHRDVIPSDKAKWKAFIGNTGDGIVCFYTKYSKGATKGQSGQTHAGVSKGLGVC